MKKLLALITAGFLVSCSADQTTEMPEENLTTPSTDSVTTIPENKESEVVDTVEETLLIAELTCVDKGMDEWDVPHSEVLVKIGDKLEKVAECLACQTITQEDYSDYDVPKNAISACGGWWAGGGDYFYAIRNSDNEIEVYAGWQDEGQMEDNDTSFHWELKKTYK